MEERSQEDIKRYESEYGSNYVYIATPVPAGNIKVGFSSSIENRIRNLQTGSANHLEFECLPFLSRNEAAEFEKRIHKEFSRYRLKGEWFCNSVLEPLQEFLKTQYYNSWGCSSG